MLKRKCGLRDKNIDDVRVFENYSLVSVPFSDAEAVVGQLNASEAVAASPRLTVPMRRTAAESGAGRLRRVATAAGASGSESAGEPRSRRGAAGRPGEPEGAEGSARKAAAQEAAETADDAGERRSVTRSRKKAENDWNASPAGGSRRVRLGGFPALRRCRGMGEAQARRRDQERPPQRPSRHHGPSGCAQTHCRKGPQALTKGRNRPENCAAVPGCSDFALPQGGVVACFDEIFSAFRIKWLYLQDLYAPAHAGTKNVY
ncbi:MAG: DbpA RNA binding domain-containing protein [Alistipes shahii]